MAGYIEQILNPVTPTPTLTPTRFFSPTPTRTPVPVVRVEGCVAANVVNARTGPGRAFPVAAGLAAKTCLKFDAQSADGKWLRLADRRGPKDSRLWVSAEFIALKESSSRLPLGE